MAKGVSIGIGADTRDFSKAVSKGVIDPLEDAQDALDDVARDGDKAGDKLERSFKDAQKQTEKFGRELSPLAREMDKQTKRGADDVARNTERGFDRAEEAAGAFKDEAVQNFAETASSFDGSMDSIADMAQSTLGGLATAIPGIGIALAGLGAAGGLFYNQWAQAAEDTEERISSMYDDMLESGQNYLSADFINQALAELAKDDGRMADVTRRAEDLGLAVEDVMIAEVTAGNERDRVMGKARDQYLALLKLAGEYEDGMTHTGNPYASQAGSMADIVEHYTDLNKEQEKTIDKIEATRTAQDKVNSSITGGVKQAQELVTEFGKVPTEKEVIIRVNDEAVRNWRAPMLPPVNLDITAKFRRSIP